MSRKAPVEPEAPPVVGVCADPATDMNLLKAAARIAVDLNLPFLEKPARAGYDMLLCVTPDQVQLRVLKGDVAIRGGNPVAVDLSKINTKPGAGGSLSQPIAKAVGLKKKSDSPIVIDTTAGWGEDSWLMASLGCRVLTVERNKVVATLLRDGLFRIGAAHPDVFGRVHLITSDARHMLRRIARGSADGEEGELPPQMQDFLHPEVVYLDPMFPNATRKSAERKPMKVLRRLAGDDPDQDELFDWAMAVAKRRVVVKRPAKSDPLRDEPTMTFKAKGLRYDVYVVNR